MSRSWERIRCGVSISIQLLHKGTRWVYQKPGWFGDFDNCLWDILGKVADMPVCELIGKVRDHFPVYLTSGDAPLEEYLEVIEQGREYGVNAYKFHTYKGGKADISILPLQPHDMWEGTVRPSVVEDSCLPTPGGFPEVERAHHHLSLHCNVIGE